MVFDASLQWLAFGVLDDLALFNANADPSYLAIGRALERILLSGAARNVAEARGLLLDALVLRALVDAYHHGVAADLLLTSTALTNACTLHIGKAALPARRSLARR